MKRAIAWLLMFALLISSLPLEIVAAEDATQSAENQEISAAEETVATTESTEATLEESSIVASGTCGDNLSWSLDTDGLLTISGSGNMITAPWSDYYSDIKAITLEKGVTSICSSAFEACYNLKTIVIPECVTSIGTEAFLDCSGLISITIPDGVSVIHQNTFTGCASLASVTLSGNLTTIEEQAFSFCESLEEIVLPESLESIGDSAFYGCDMLKIASIPSNVTSIGDEAFRSCETLTAIEIPASVAEIGEMPFANCSNLTGIWVDEANPYYSSDSAGVLFNKDQTILIQAPGALSGNYQMPDSVITVGCGSFYGNALEEIGISENTVCIEASTFCRTSLQTVTLPASVVTVERNAFSSCAELESVIISDGVAFMDVYAFSDCSNLTEIRFLGDAPLGGGLVFDGVAATAYYPLGNETWTDYMKERLGGTLTWITYGAAASGICGDSLTWELTEDGTLFISGSGDMADYTASLAPWSTYSVASVVIESGVTSVSSGAFSGCSDLTEIKFKGDAPVIGETAFDGVSANVFYPANNTTWTSETLQNYGGSLVWTALLDLPYPEIERDVATTALIPRNGWAYFQFTPEYTETYYICSVAEGSDTYGILCDSSMNILAENDDYSAREFGITYTLEAGETYVLGVRYYSWLHGSFEVILQSQHEYVTEIVTEATCIENGLKRHTCQICGVVKEEVYSADHSFGSDSVCTVCGFVEGLTGTCGENVNWVLGTNGVLTISGTGAMTDYDWVNPSPFFDYKESVTNVVIEDGVTSIGALSFVEFSNLNNVEIPDSVTSIGADAFCCCENLKNIVIPESVTVIGGNAFFCSGLVSVEIPNGVTTIEYGTFSGCYSLISITLPDSVTSIGEQAFHSCSSLTAFTIPNNVTSIGGLAFSGCDSLTAVTIPASVTTIGEGVFSWCSSLLKIEVFEDNAYYSSDASGVLFNKDKTELVCMPGAFSGAYSIPDSVTTIGESAFCSCDSLTTVTIPDSVTTIGASAFRDCASLTAVTIGDSVTIVGESAFQGCDGLTAVTIPASVTTIGEGVFSWCSSLLKIEVFEDNAYYSSDASGVLFNKDKTELVCMPGAFSGAYSIPDSVTTIGESAFYSCESLTAVAIPASVTTIGGQAFVDCTRLTTVTIPDSVTTIGEYAFGFCTSLISVTIGNGVTIINNCAFYSCESLTAVTIPGSVTTIGNYAFGFCPNLTNIQFVGDAPDFGHYAFYDVTATAYYPAGNETWTTDIMQDYGGTITWVAYENSGVSCAGMSLSLNGDIGVNFYMTLSDEVLADENTRMVFNVGGAAHEMALADALTDTQDDGSVWYRFSCAVPAKGMTDTISAQIYGTDGAVGEVMTYSVAEYYNDICEQFDREEKAELFAMIEAMLNYGAASQEYFGYNTESLANAAVTTAVPETVDASAFAGVVNDTDALLDYAGASLVLESNTVLRVFFRTTAGADISSYAFAVNGETVTPVQRGNLWYIELTDIAAKELDAFHTFTAGDVTVEASALSYVNAVLNKADALNEKLVAVCKALYAYNEAANTYFGA